jgi:hypothetical protein
VPATKKEQDGERRSGQIAQYPQSEAPVYAPIARCDIGVFEAFIASVSYQRLRSALADQGRSWPNPDLNRDNVSKACVASSPRVSRPHLPKAAGTAP